MDEAIKIVKIGIEIEKNGMKNYLDFAFRTKDQTGKNMFIRLSRDEFDHMAVLEKELESLSSQKSWLKEEIPESIIEKISPKLRDIDKIKSEEGVGELGALKTALELEKRSIEFYKSSGDKVKDKHAVAIFGRLVEMEESHYDLIQAEIDHIENTGFWFGIPEFSLEVERE